MIKKYTFIDDYGCLFGTCDEILGLAEEYILEENEEPKIVQITLVNFMLDSSFQKYRYRSHVLLESMNIVVRNQANQILCELYFSPDKKIIWEQEKFERNLVFMELRGGFFYSLSPMVLKVWDIWKENLPTIKNEWTFLSFDLKVGWLEATRHHANRNIRNIDGEKEVYEIDTMGIQDEVTFFLALGEALVGPGGYYGWDILSLDDLLYSDPKIQPPFILSFKNGEKNMVTNLDEIFLGKKKEFLQRIRRLFTKYGVRINN